MYRIISDDQVVLGVAGDTSIDKKHIDLGRCSLYLSRVLFVSTQMKGDRKFSIVDSVLPDRFSVEEVDYKILFEGCRVASYEKACWVETDDVVVIEGLTVFHERKKPTSEA